LNFNQAFIKSFNIRLSEPFEPYQAVSNLPLAIYLLYGFSCIRVLSRNQSPAPPPERADIILILSLTHGCWVRKFRNSNRGLAQHPSKPLLSQMSKCFPSRPAIPDGSESPLARRVTNTTCNFK